MSSSTTFPRRPLPAFWCALTCLLSAWATTADAETAVLESTDGRKIKVELLEKGKDKVKVKMDLKTFTIPFEKLSPESVELVKAAPIPTICDFRILGNFDKDSDKVSQDRRESVPDGEGGFTYEIHTDSYRIDTITGSVKVQNRDGNEASPKAELHVVTLCRGDGGDEVIRRDVLEVPPIEPLAERDFKIGESRSWHTHKGLNSFRPHDIPAGRYRGYIAAIVIDGRIAELKAVPVNYERDPEAVRKLIQIEKDR